jgi:hypothetical protein
MGQAATKKKIGKWRERVRGLAEIAEKAQWAEFARQWAQEPPCAEDDQGWGLVRRPLSRGLRLTPGGDDGGDAARALLAKSEWPLAERALLRNQEWIKRQAEGAPWCNDAFERISWPVAELEAAAAPEALADRRHWVALTEELAMRRATAEELDRLDAWGQKSESRWVLSAEAVDPEKVARAWGEVAIGLCSTVDEWLARTRNSGQAFLARGLLRAEDIEERLADSLSRRSFATLEANALGVLAWLSALPEERARAALEARGARWLEWVGAADRLAAKGSFPAAANAAPIVARAVAKIEAILLTGAAPLAVGERAAAGAETAERPASKGIRL